MRVRSLAPFALGMFALLAMPAWAQTSPANALREWGLLGWWSVRCDQPVSASNFYFGYVIDADGRAWHERDLGDPGRNDKSEITSAEIKPEGTIVITVSFTSVNQVRTIVFAREQSRMRAMYNRGSDGDVTVENGIFKHNGRPTPWQFKCREAS